MVQADSLATTGPLSIADIARRIHRSMSMVVAGKSDAINASIMTLLAGGHLLIEDVPGVGKTTLATVLARSIEAGVRRIQFTADMMPTDVTGLSIYDQQEQKFRFHQGPIFTNIVIADEINRATPRTQSALLEAMEERRVSVDGVTAELTTREFTLLEMFMRHPEAVLSREQLLSRVWGLDFDPGSNVVDVYVRYLRGKIGDGRVETVRGAGYRLRA